MKFTKWQMLVLAGALILSLTSCRLGRRDQGQGGGAEPPANSNPAASPVEPTDCRVASATSTSLTLAWDFAGDEAGIEGFIVYQGVTSVEKRVGSSKRSVTIGNLQPGVQYHFDVRAYNAAGESEADACFVDATTTQ
ncbi:MAG: fibronectin type III domain-containing protein [Chloroflexota bacterium]